MTRRWDTLRDVTALLYATERQGLEPIVARERRLRGELGKLDGFDRAARQAEDGETALKAVGADMAWNSWLAATRTHLNTELAQVLAIKEQRMDRLRAAHAREKVAGALAKRAQKTLQAKLEKAALTAQIDATLFRK